MGTKNQPGAFDCYGNADPDLEAHTILWELAKWQGKRSAREARLVFAEEVAALARADQK